MIRALIIGDAERALIDEAVRRAREHPLSPKDVQRIGETVPQGQPHLSLADRSGDVRRGPSEPWGVELPGGFQAAISFEHQPIGLCRHLSVSVDKPGYLPHMAAVGMIAEAFGFVAGMERHIWVEEFKPGCHAVNVVEPVLPASTETRQ